MKIIGMVVAMQSEVESFLSGRNLELVREKKGGFQIMKFTLGENKIVCVQSGVGEIFASAATQMPISEYKVDLILNFGVCGSLVDGVGVGSVVLVDGVVHYDFDTSPIDDVEVGRYLQYPETVLRPDKGLLDLVCGFMPSVEKVICASADKFVADEKIKEDLAKRYGASICEMECAGVLLTCLNANVPCLIIKAVSDGKGGAEEFKKMVHSSSKQYVELIYKLSESV